MLIKPLAPAELTREILNLFTALADTRQLALVDARRLMAEQQARGHLTFVGYRGLWPVAVACLVLEQKLIHNGGKVAHVEDVCVHSECRRLGYGSMMLEHLEAQAALHGCYKVILDCTAELVPFYECCGYRCHGAQLRKDLPA